MNRPRRSSIPSKRSAVNVKAVNALTGRLQAAHVAGRNEEALALALQLTSVLPAMPNPWIDAAVSAVLLNRLDDAVKYLARAAQRGGEGNFIYHDTASHVFGLLAQWDKVAEHGCKALAMRATQFGADAAPLLHHARPAAPSAATRERNAIAFSLFGDLPMYCETAVLNARRQAEVYPHWQCRFYVDDSVPAPVLARLSQHGARCIRVADEVRARWPGPMWRLLAHDEPELDRVLFRDADSVICEREAQAVDEWVCSEACFHLMRDAATHTELILAGLWGACTRVLPPLAP